MKFRTRNKVYESGKCKNCGSENIEAVKYSDTVDFRGLQLNVEDLEVTLCRSCRFKFENDEQSEKNNEVKKSVYLIERDRIRTSEGLLSGPEIYEIRCSFGLAQRDAAALFGGGYNAFNKYESGEVLQSVAMDRLLRVARSIGKPALGLLQTIVNLSHSQRPEDRQQLSNLKLFDNLTVAVNVGYDGEEFILNVNSIQAKAAIISVIAKRTFIPEPDNMPPILRHTIPSGANIQIGHQKIAAKKITSLMEI